MQEPHRSGQVCGWQVVAEPAGGRDDVRHRDRTTLKRVSITVESRPALALGRLALTREPFDLAALGGRLARVRPVPELIADQVRHVAPSPDWAPHLRIARGLGDVSDPGHGRRAAPVLGSARRYDRAERRGPPRRGLRGRLLVEGVGDGLLQGHRMALGPDD